MYLTIFFLTGQLLWANQLDVQGYYLKTHKKRPHPSKIHHNSCFVCGSDFKVEIVISTIVNFYIFDIVG